MPMLSDTPLFDQLLAEQPRSSYIRELLGFGYRDELLPGSPPRATAAPLIDALRGRMRSALARAAETLTADVEPLPADPEPVMPTLFVENDGVHTPTIVTVEPELLAGATGGVPLLGDFDQYRDPEDDAELDDEREQLHRHGVDDVPDAGVLRAELHAGGEQ
jgi:hypothetical protein